MSRILTFTNGLLTSVSGSEINNSLGARKFTFINGMLTSVSEVIPGLIRTNGQMHFINGFLTSTDLFQFSGSSGSSPASASPSISPSASPSMGPTFLDFRFDTDLMPGNNQGQITWSGFANVVWDSTVYHNALGSAKARYQTFGDLNTNAFVYNGPPYPVVNDTVIMKAWFKTSGINLNPGLNMTIGIYSNYSGSYVADSNYMSVTSDIDWTEVVLTVAPSQIGAIFTNGGIVVDNNGYGAPVSEYDVWIDDIEIFGE